MNGYRSHSIKNILLPCLGFSAITGVCSALLITVFKWAAGIAVAASERMYEVVRENPVKLPWLLLGAAFLGLLVAGIMKFSRSIRGGGIPASIAAIRGLTDFKWLKSAFLLPISALLTFLSGVPLGTEGPCVQMGTAVGDGTIRLFGKEKHRGWRRYLMTGGASAGFSLATGAPITAIVFSMEEIHGRFSPLLVTVTAMSVSICQLTAQLLEHFGFGSIAMFHMVEIPAFSPLLVFAPLVVGLLCGFCALFFTKLYDFIDRMVKSYLQKLPKYIKFPLIFVCVALIGFFFEKFLGTGHALIDHLMEGHLYETEATWHLLIIVFLVRGVLMMVSNTAGVTGGIFLPTLASGAIIGALCAEVFIALGFIDAEFYILFVVIGMAAFLGASSRIPVTACMFAIEALCGFHNILPIIIATIAAFLVVELSGLEDFTGTVVHAKTKEAHGDKKAQSIDVPLTVCPGSFVIDKELRDILWPASCVVLGMEKGPNKSEKVGIAAGDVLTVHYVTYDPEITAQEFEQLVGDQCEEIDRLMRPV